MTDLTLFHGAPSRSSIVRWMLEETGEPYRLHLLDMKRGEQREPAFLAVNPMGKVPALKHGEVIVTETAAICLYLAEAFPKAGLDVPVGDPRRGAYLKWLFFGPSCLEPAVTDQAYKRVAEAPRGALGYGDLQTVLDVLAEAVRSGPFILGDRFTAADVVIGSGLRWGMFFKMLPERREFLAYTACLNERPAFKRAQAKDQELAAA